MKMSRWFQWFNFRRSKLTEKLLPKGSNYSLYEEDSDNVETVDNIEFRFLDPIPKSLKTSRFTGKSVQNAVQTSYDLGQDGEKSVYELLQRYFNNTTYVGSTPRSGDIAIQFHGTHIMVEVKNYKNAVPRTEITKFERDLNATATYDAGIFISLKSRIVGVKSDIECRIIHKNIPVILLSQPTGALLVTAVQLLGSHIQSGRIADGALTRHQMDIIKNLSTLGHITEGIAKKHGEYHDNLVKYIRAYNQLREETIDIIKQHNEQQDQITSMYTSALDTSSLSVSTMDPSTGFHTPKTHVSPITTSIDSHKDIIGVFNRHDPVRIGPTDWFVCLPSSVVVISIGVTKTKIRWQFLDTNHTCPEYIREDDGWYNFSFNKNDPSVNIVAAGLYKVLDIPE